jgi:hypothetical protein
LLSRKAETAAALGSGVSDSSSSRIIGFSIFFLALELWDRKSKREGQGKDSGTAAAGENSGRGVAESRNRKSSFQTMFSGQKRSKLPGLPPVQA